MEPGLRTDCRHLGQPIGKLILRRSGRAAAVACIKVICSDIRGRAFSTLEEGISEPSLPESATLVL